MTWRGKSLDGPSKFDALPASEQEKYKATLQKSGLANSEAEYASVNDKVFNGGRGAAEKIFSVSGRPVLASRMTPEIVSYHMGTNIFTAARLAGAHHAGDPLAITREMESLGATPENIERAKRLSHLVKAVRNTRKIFGFAGTLATAGIAAAATLASGGSLQKQQKQAAKLYLS
jgi:hypothetical protein